MKHVKLFEAYPYPGADGMEMGSEMMPPSKEKIIQGSTLFFNMMPDEIRNELPRAVKDMLLGANPRSPEWQSIEEVIDKLERLRVRTAIQWKDLLKPFITRKISGLKNLEQFSDWLSSIYNYGMEEVVFGQDSKPMTYVNEDPKVYTIDKFLSSEYVNEGKDFYLKF